jgi:hypothetical protein
MDFSKMDAVIIIWKYSELQKDLVQRLLVSYRPKDLEFFRDISDGRIECRGTWWTHRRHGAGVKFLSATTDVVDAHVGMAAHPNAVDAWRLLEYFESQGVSEVEFMGKEYAADDEGALEDLLRQMTRAGKLKEVTYKSSGWGAPHSLFVPASIVPA